MGEGGYFDFILLSPSSMSYFFYCFISYINIANDVDITIRVSISDIMHYFACFTCPFLPVQHMNSIL